MIDPSPMTVKDALRVPVRVTMLLPVPVPVPVPLRAPAPVLEPARYDGAGSASALGP